MATRAGAGLAQAARGISKSGRDPFANGSSRTDARLAVEVAEIFGQKQKRYGSPRIWVELRNRGKRHSEASRASSANDSCSDRDVPWCVSVTREREVLVSVRYAWA